MIIIARHVVINVGRGGVALGGVVVARSRIGGSVIGKGLRESFGGVGDGGLDVNDARPNVPEDPDGFEDEDGCPDEVQVRMVGAEILLDARVPGGPPGGTGARFDWALAGRLAQERVLLLAGGLTPANVAEAVRRVRPHMVDVASGVETAPGVKDAEAMRAFVRAATAAP